MNEPEQILSKAAAERLVALARVLREEGWAAEVTVFAEGPAVALRIDLSGLKKPEGA